MVKYYHVRSTGGGFGYGLGLLDAPRGDSMVLMSGDWAGQTMTSMSLSFKPLGCLWKGVWGIVLLNSLSPSGILAFQSFHHSPYKKYHSTGLLMIPWTSVGTPTPSHPHSTPYIRLFPHPCWLWSGGSVRNAFSFSPPKYRLQSDPILLIVVSSDPKILSNHHVNFMVIGQIKMVQSMNRFWVQDCFCLTKWSENCFLGAFLTVWGRPTAASDLSSCFFCVTDWKVCCWWNGCPKQHYQALPVVIWWIVDLLMAQD